MILATILYLQGRKLQVQDLSIRSTRGKAYDLSQGQDAAALAESRKKGVQRDD